MARILRTSARPNRSIMHECRDARGKRVQRKGRVGRLCTTCQTYIVYVFDNTPKPKRRDRRRRYG